MEEGMKLFIPKGMLSRSERDVGREYEGAATETWDRAKMRGYVEIGQCPKAVQLVER